MNLFASSPVTSSKLTEKYRPRTIAAFIGLDKPKRMCAKLAAAPFESSWLFVGKPGLGKTAMALALADEMGAELHHVPSQDCNVETLRRVVSSCQYVPSMGHTFHLVLVDEADQMSKAAQLYLLSKLDATSFPPSTIFVFTCNATDGLEDRFISRCGVVEFSNYAIASEGAALLESVFTAEAPADCTAPNFARLMKDANNNVRGALMALQMHLMLA